MTTVEGAKLASTFLANMFGASTVAPVYISSLPNTDAKDREVGERHVATRDPEHVEAFRGKWDRKDRGLYFAVATVKAGATTRKKETLDELNCLHVDIDFKSVANAGPAEIERRLRETMFLPSFVTLSGNGLHAYWCFRENLPATKENIARVEALLRLLADHLAGDPACAEASRLMRLPGSHNTKDGAWKEVPTLVSEPTRRYEIDDLAEWLETASPVIARKPTTGGNGHDDDVAADNPWLDHGERFSNKPAIDIDARLAAMTYQGADDSGVHTTQLSVTAAMLGRGDQIDEIVSVVLDETRRAAGSLKWNWRKEEADIRDMCEDWLTKHPEVRIQPEDARKAEPQQSALHWHGDVDPDEGRAWLAQNLLPETGKGLVSGQWGVYKTFVVLDLAAAVIAGASFIDFKILRRGGVLFVAAEGGSEIPVRLQAVLENKYPQIERAPFAWTNTCPKLLGRKAVSELVTWANEAAARMQQEFGLPLALIVIDTVVAAAGYSKVGEESDAAVGQAIMNVLEEVAQRTGALVLGVDHFGKSAETGTRGTSAKEGSADVVLALLGAKSISGEVTDTRLATRKRRSGASGEEFPFTVQSVDLGVDLYGGQITSLVIHWGAKNSEPEKRERWSKSLRLLRQALMSVLVDHGREQRPFPDGPLVRAVDLEIVRQEFHRSYPAEGDAATRHATRRKAFHRAIVAAQEQGLIGVREVNDVTMIWLINPQDEVR